jgi:hypothetical protein
MYFTHCIISSIEGDFENFLEKIVEAVVYIQYDRLLNKNLWWIIRTI